MQRASEGVSHLCNPPCTQSDGSDRSDPGEPDGGGRGRRVVRARPSPSGPARNPSTRGPPGDTEGLSCLGPHSSTSSARCDALCRQPGPAAPPVRCPRRGVRRRLPGRSCQGEPSSSTWPSMIRRCPKSAPCCRRCRGHHPDVVQRRGCPVRYVRHPGSGAGLAVLRHGRIHPRIRIDATWLSRPTLLFVRGQPLLAIPNPGDELCQGHEPEGTEDEEYPRVTAKEERPRTGEYSVDGGFAEVHGHQDDRPWSVPRHQQHDRKWREPGDHEDIPPEESEYGGVCRILARWLVVLAGHRAVPSFVMFDGPDATCPRGSQFGWHDPGTRSYAQQRLSARPSSTLGGPRRTAVNS